MKTSEMAVLLLVPLILIVLSAGGLHSSATFESFDKQLEEKSLAQVHLESRLADMEATINADGETFTKERAREVLSVTRDTLIAVRGLFDWLGDFSDKIGSWTKQQSYYILFLALLNGVLVVSVYRSSKRVQ